MKAKLKNPCAICQRREASDECPCGKKMCEECTDPSIYTDQDVCASCASEIREAWQACSHPDFEEPYENEDGNVIAECKKCSFPKIIQEAVQ